MWNIRYPFSLRNEKDERVLVLEESPQNHSYLQKVFNKKYETLTASEKDEAYRIAVNLRPGLIVLPSKLNGNKTVDLCINLKSEEQTRNIPILVIAENGSNIVEYYFQKIEGYLIKPLRERELLNCAESLIRGSQSINRQFYQTKSVRQTYAKISFYRNTGL